MKIARTSGTLGLVALAVIASPFAVAADYSGWYLGGSVGQSRAKIDEARIVRSLVNTGFTVTSYVDDNRDTGGKIFGGYQFNRNFAVEAGYFDLGTLFSFVATTGAPNAGTLNGDIEVRGVNLDLVGMLPITEKFSALGRVGAQYAESKDRFSGTGAVVVTNPNPQVKDTNYKFGVGLQYDFTPALGVRAEAERYRINDAVGNKGDVDLYSVGLVYRFGAKTPAPAPSPAPAPAAAPAPRPAAAPPPPPPPAAVKPAPPPPAPIEKAPRKDRN